MSKTPRSNHEIAKDLFLYSMQIDPYESSLIIEVMREDMVTELMRYTMAFLLADRDIHGEILNLPVFDPYRERIKQLTENAFNGSEELITDEIYSLITPLTSEEISQIDNYLGENNVYLAGSDEAH